MPYVFHDDGAPEAEDFDSNYDFIEDEESPVWNLENFDSDWDKDIQGAVFSGGSATQRTAKRQGWTRTQPTLWTRIIMLLRH